MTRALVVALLATGCISKSVEDIQIKCTADSECPTGAFCDLSPGGDVCHELTVEDMPHLELVGFVIGDQIADTLTVRRETITLHKLRLHNDTARGEDVDVEVSALACVHADAVTNPDGYTIDRGKTLDIDFSVRPDASCASPAQLTITCTADRRPFMFQRSISFDPIAVVSPFRQ